MILLYMLARIGYRHDIKKNIYIYNLKCNSLVAKIYIIVNYNNNNNNNYIVYLKKNVNDAFIFFCYI